MASRAPIEPEVVSGGPDTVKIFKNADEFLRSLVGIPALRVHR